MPWLIENTVEVRPDDKGGFDELLLYDGMGRCIVHAEMMDDDCLWIGIYPPTELDRPSMRRAVMWIRTSGRKLEVRADDD